MASALLKCLQDFIKMEGIIMLEIMELKCNHQRTPYGITGTPVLSWQLRSEEQNTIQEAYQLLIYNSDVQYMIPEKLNPRSRLRLYRTVFL